MNNIEKEIYLAIDLNSDIFKEVKYYIDKLYNCDDIKDYPIKKQINDIGWSIELLKNALKRLENLKLNYNY